MENNSGMVPNQADKMNEEDQGEDTQLDPETLDRIQHPQQMSDSLREQSPTELMANPSLVPVMIQEGGDLRHDLFKGDNE